VITWLYDVHMMMVAILLQFSLLWIITLALSLPVSVCLCLRLSVCLYLCLRLSLWYTKGRHSIFYATFDLIYSRQIQKATVMSRIPFHGQMVGIHFAFVYIYGLMLMRILCARMYACRRYVYTCVCMTFSPSALDHTPTSSLYSMLIRPCVCSISPEPYSYFTLPYANSAMCVFDIFSISPGPWYSYFTFTLY
jgi:hypothetical protein